jgi:hypothetical protein
MKIEYKSVHWDEIALNRWASEGWTVVQGLVSKSPNNDHWIIMEKNNELPLDDTARELLVDWLDVHDEDCWYDHHGYCQAHFLSDAENCVVKRTRDMLSKGTSED